jgi:hypothetical protein
MGTYVLHEHTFPVKGELNLLCVYAVPRVVEKLTERSGIERPEAERTSIGAASALRPAHPDLLA